jgi:hypothetical protein
METTRTRPSVPLAVTTTAIFWSVGWSALIRAIIESSNKSLIYASLNLPKTNVLIYLIIILALYTIVLVRWLSTIQQWTFDVSMREFFLHSAGLIFVIITLYSIIDVVVVGFQIPYEWAVYSKWAITMWPIIPFLMVII